MEVHLKQIISYLEESVEIKNKLLNDKECLSIISQVSELLIETFRNGNKVILAGNGGSAGDAQHIAAEFVSRFYFDRPGLPAIALTTDTSMITAIANDYGYENLFSRQVQAQGRSGDVFIGISTSGNSKNVVKAIHEAKSLGVVTVALCGEGGELPNIADYAIRVPSSSTPYIQECHICVGHVMCGIVERVIFGGS
jgi:D-sedoheptulose 7-phosphate isomerase